MKDKLKTAFCNWLGSPDRLVFTVILVFVGIHLPGWLRGFDHIQDQAQKTADSVNGAGWYSMEASQQMLNLVGSGTKLVDSVSLSLIGDTKHEGTFAKANRVLDSASDLEQHTTKQVDDIIPKANTFLDTLNQDADEAAKKLNASLDMLPGILGRMPGIEDRIGGLVETGNGTLVSVTRFVDGPLTTDMNDMHGVFVPVGLFMTDVQRKYHDWAYPANQSKLMKTYKFIRGVSPLAQPTYYGIKIFKDE